MDLLEVFKKMKPVTILENIEKEAIAKNLKVPKISDLYNFLYTLNIKAVGRSNMTIGNLIMIKKSTLFI